MNNNFSFKTSKGDIFKSMMSKPDTAKLIKEAMSSPVGSTSRAKAKKIFSIMNKLNSSNDGVGGPGMMYNQMFQNQMPEQSYAAPIQTTPKSMVIFHKIPTPKITYGKKPYQFKVKESVKYDGAGGPGIKDGEGGVFSNLANFFSTPFSSYQNQSLNTSPNAFGGSSDPARLQEIQGMGLSVNPLPKTTSALTNPIDQNAVSGQNTMFGKPIGTPGTMINGVFVPQKAETLNTNPNQPVYTPSTKTITPDPRIAELGLKVGNYVPQKKTGFIDQDGNPIMTELTPDYNTKPSTPVDTSERKVYGNGVFSGGGTPTPTDMANQDTLTADNTWESNWSKVGPGLPTDTKKVPEGWDETTYDNFKKANPDLEPDSEDTARMNGTYKESSTPVITGPTTGYGGEIVPALKDKKVSELTPEEMQLLYDTQKKREGSTLPNNPFGIKLGKATEHWITDGKAVKGGEARDGGNFLIFKDESAANEAYKELLYGANYSNLTVDQAMKKWSGYGPVGGSSQTGTANQIGSSLGTNVQNAVDSHTGAGMFALNQMEAENGGKSMEQLIAENEDKIWDKYNIESLVKEKSRLEEEKTYLPSDVTEWIRSRDKYLVATDKNISRFIKDSMENTDMSNPTNIQNANAQLNYLYTLRGRQNQSYIGFLNKAVEEQQRNLDRVSTDLTNSLSFAERELKSDTAVIQGGYTARAAALADMYTEVSEAPLKTLQLNAYKDQVTDASSKAVTDALKLSAQTGFIEQGNKLEGYVWDTNHRAMIETNLVDEINKFATLDPSIQTANIIQAYSSGVVKYMSTPNEKDEVTGTGITSAKKKEMAEKAIRNFAQFSVQGSINNDDNAILLGATEAYAIADTLAAQVASSLTTKSPLLMEAVKTLAPRGIFGAKASPSEDEFVKTVVNKTGDSGDDIIAKAIYAQFKQYIEDDGNQKTSPASAVNALLYNTSSTEQRSEPVPYTASDFAKVIGKIYADLVVQSEFSQISDDMSRLSS